MKREHGEAYPTGTESMAAPATVSDETRFIRHWSLIGKAKRIVRIAKPGDLPQNYPREICATHTNYAVGWTEKD